MYSILISFVVYVIASWYISKLISEFFEPGFTKKLVVFILASVISYMTGIFIDWAFPSQAISLFGDSHVSQQEDQKQMEILLKQM